MRSKTYYWKGHPVAEIFPNPMYKKKIEWRVIPPYDMCLMFMNPKYVIHLEDGTQDNNIKTVEDLRKAIFKIEIDPGLQ